MSRKDRAMCKFAYDIEFSPTVQKVQADENQADQAAYQAWQDLFAGDLALIKLSGVLLPLQRKREHK